MDGPLWDMAGRWQCNLRAGHVLSTFIKTQLFPLFLSFLGCRTIPPSVLGMTFPQYIMHTYIYMYADTHTYTYIHTHIHTYIHTYIYTCIHIHTYTYTSIHTYTSVCMYASILCILP